MSKQEKPQESSNQESTLNDYHQKRSREAIEEVKLMMMNPCSYEEKLLQAEKINSEFRNK